MFSRRLICPHCARMVLSSPTNQFIYPVCLAIVVLAIILSTWLYDVHVSDNLNTAAAVGIGVGLCLFVPVTIWKCSYVKSSQYVVPVQSLRLLSAEELNLRQHRIIDDFQRPYILWIDNSVIETA